MHPRPRSMRAIITAIVLSLYVLSFNGYMYGFFYMDIDKFWIKLFYYWLLTIITLFLIIDELLQYKSFLHKQFNIITKISVLINIILITFTYQLPIAVEPAKAFFLFNGSVFASTMIILISGGRHGVFNKD